PVIPATFGIILFISGHSRLLMQCPLYPQKRTLDGANEMSARGQNGRAISARFIFSHDHSPPNSPKFFEQEQGRTAESLVGLTRNYRVAIEPSSFVTASRRRSSYANCESESSRAPMTTMRSPRRANLTNISPQASRSGKAKAFRPHRWISQTISSLPTLRSTVPPK